MGLVRRFRSLFVSGTTVLTCVNIKSVEPKEKKNEKGERKWGDASVTESSGAAIVSSAAVIKWQRLSKSN